MERQRRFEKLEHEEMAGVKEDREEETNMQTKTRDFLTFKVNPTPILTLFTAIEALLNYVQPFTAI